MIYSKNRKLEYLKQKLKVRKEQVENEKNK